MTRLLAIRDLNQGDPLPGLGPKVEPERKPAPAERPQPLPHNPEVLRKPDGKLETDISKNKGVAWQRSGLMTDPEDLSWMLWEKRLRDSAKDFNRLYQLDDMLDALGYANRAAERLREEVSGITPVMQGTVTGRMPSGWAATPNTPKADCKPPSFAVGDEVIVTLYGFYGTRGKVLRVYDTLIILDSNRGTMVFYPKDLKHVPRPQA